MRIEKLILEKRKDKHEVPTFGANVVVNESNVWVVQEVDRFVVEQ